VTVLHFVVDFVYPSPGGMQAAILRIAKQLDAKEGFRSILYTRRQQAQFRERVSEHGDVEIVHLANRKERLMEPRGADDGSSEILPSEYLVHAYQVDIMLLQQEIEERQLRDSKSPTRHLLVSFYAPKAGFVAQVVALSLGLPHICSFRGSDYSVHLANPFLGGAVRFVAERADLVLTTNEQQARVLSSVFPGTKTFQTIYNSVEFSNGINEHVPPEAPPIRLFSDCEFSLKKATHVLMEATAALHEEGLPISLEIVGQSSNDEDEYWTKLKKGYSESHPGVFSFPGRISSTLIEQRLMRSHVYCSATLSEGCSHARIRALLMGLPIVTTRCGALGEYAPKCSHISYARPGDLPDFVRQLRLMVNAVRSGSVAIDKNRVQSARERFSADREREDWEAAIETVLGAE